MLVCHLAELKWELFCNCQQCCPDALLACMTCVCRLLATPAVKPLVAKCADCSMRHHIT